MLGRTNKSIVSVTGTVCSALFLSIMEATIFSYTIHWYTSLLINYGKGIVRTARGLRSHQIYNSN